MVKTYIFLIAAIFCEVAGTMLLPVSQNFTKLIPTIDDPAILTEIKEDLINHKILNNG